MKVTKIKPSDTKLILELKQEIEGNRTTIENLSSINELKKKMMFKIASGGNRKLIEEAVLNDDCTELISFADANEVLIRKVRDVKNCLVKMEDFELGAKIREIEKKLIDRNK